MSLRLVKQRSKLRRTAAAATDDGGSSRAAEERITSFSAANAGRLPFIWRTLTPKTSRTFTSFLSIVVVAAASAAAEIALCCYWLSFRSYKIVCRRAEAEAKTANTKQSLGRILTPLHAHAFSTLFTKRPSSWLAAVALTEKKQLRQCTLFFF